MAANGNPRFDCGLPVSIILRIPPYWGCPVAAVGVGVGEDVGVCAGAVEGVDGCPGAGVVIGVDVGACDGVGEGAGAAQAKANKEAMMHKINPR